MPSYFHVFMILSLSLLACKMPNSKQVALSAEEKQATKSAIQRFIDGGSNLAKPHELEFIIALKSKSDAKQVKNDLKAIELEFNSTEVDGKDFIAKRKMLLDLDAIIDVESRLMYIAEKNNAVYEGWGGFEVE